jgi:UDP-N-acetylmuramate--alanine ligase
MVVEADESDGTFIKIPTQIGVVTSIDPEHLDYFGSVARMHQEYETFFRNIPFYGLAVTCIDHPVAREMIERLGLRHDGRRLLTYGISPEADLRLVSTRVDGVHTVFDAELSERVVGGARRIEGWSVPVPGEHNALNALAAIAVCTETGLSDCAIQSSLARFAGVKRRFQPTGTWNGITVYDDYGHHPTEIAAVLKAARAGTKGRVVAVVEPHRYSRVKDLFNEFAMCLGDADAVIVAPLYSAGEAPVPGIDHRFLAAAMIKAGHPSVSSVDSDRDLAAAIRAVARSGDIVVCFGAGNSTEWAYELPARLAETAPRLAGGVG